jgi:DNA-binding GntR family transcriptional regulator
MNEKIYQEIKHRILYLEYEPGQYINEKQLASEFGVSRTPIREVLLRLEWEKLISMIPRSGIMVTKIDFQDLRDVYRSRVFIEGTIGRLASRNITDTQLAEMRELIKVCKKIGGDNSRHELIDIDSKFRDILFQAANSPTLKEISDYLYCQTLRVWYLTFDKTNIPTEVEMEVKEIEDTIDVLSKRDPDLAEELRQKVIMNWIERSYKYFTDY